MFFAVSLAHVASNSIHRTWGYVWYQKREGEQCNDVRDWFCRNDGSFSDRLLAHGAVIVADLRMAVLRETRFTCSAGIAHNKVSCMVQWCGAILLV